MVELRTERVLLRPARAADVDDLHAVLSNPRAMRYWWTSPDPDLATTARWLDQMMAIDPADGEDFVIERSGRVIGKAGARRFPEIGFILHPDQWGQGIASEALLPILDRAFEVHDLAAVTADVDPRNAASLRLLGRFGFRETGRAARTWLVGGEWCDSIYLALARPDHASPKSRGPNAAGNNSLSR